MTVHKCGLEQEQHDVVRLAAMTMTQGELSDFLLALIWSFEALCTDLHSAAAVA